jgi:hypothetical protein
MPTIVKEQQATQLIERQSRNVINVRCSGIGTGWEMWCLLRSDVHHDNPKCDWKLEKRHLDEALERKAIIIDNGDLFCAMQGKYDKRSSKSCIRKEHMDGDYLDSLVNTAAEFYAPYMELPWIFGRGNHETAIQKAHETDLTERLVEKLKDRYGAEQAFTSGYSGWVRFILDYGKSEQIKLHHYHGSGGGGPVTRGVIQTNRMAVYTPDAHIILTGHTHDEWIVPITRQRITERGVPYHDEQLHVRAAGYKDAWGDGYSGWEVETAKGPKPKGAQWLRFSYKRTPDLERRIFCEVQRAK